MRAIVGKVWIRVPVGSGNGARARGVDRRGRAILPGQTGRGIRHGLPGDGNGPAFFAGGPEWLTYSLTSFDFKVILAVTCVALEILRMLPQQCL